MRFRVVPIALAFVAACSTTDEAGDTTSTSTTLPDGGDAPTVVVVPAPPAAEPDAPEPEPEPEPEPPPEEPAESEPPDIDVSPEPCESWVPPGVAAPDAFIVDTRCSGVLAYFGAVSNDETLCPTGHPCPDYSTQQFWIYTDGEWVVVAVGDNLSCAAPENAPMADACAQLGIAG